MIRRYDGAANGYGFSVPLNPRPDSMLPPTSVDARPRASNGKGPGALAARVASATTRLIVIAIVAGGLLTAAMNLWEPGLPVAGATGPTSTDAVARADESPLGGLPVAYRQVQGDEAAARNVTVGFC